MTVVTPKISPERKLDPRIREELVAKYGATEDVLAYLRVLEVLPDVPDDEDGENHHMLHRSAFPQYVSLRTNPWNRIRIHRGVHTGLTELQARFDLRLRRAAMQMKGKSAEAWLEVCRLGGKRVHELYPNLASEMGKRAHMLHPNLARKTGKIAGRISVESGRLASYRTPEHQRKAAAAAGKKNVESGHMQSLGRAQGKKNVESGHWASLRTSEHQRMASCSRWNISRGKPCTCSKHKEA